MFLDAVRPVCEVLVGRLLGSNALRKQSRPRSIRPLVAICFLRVFLCLTCSRPFPNPQYSARMAQQFKHNPVVVAMWRACDALSSSSFDHGRFGKRGKRTESLPKARRISLILRVPMHIMGRRWPTYALGTLRSTVPVDRRSEMAPTSSLEQRTRDVHVAAQRQTNFDRCRGLFGRFFSRVCSKSLKLRQSLAEIGRVCPEWSPDMWTSLSEIAPRTPLLQEPRCVCVGMRECGGEYIFERFGGSVPPPSRRSLGEVAGQIEELEI